MDTFLLIDDLYSPHIAVGLMLEDMRAVLVELSKNFSSAKQPLTIHVQFHTGEYGDFMIFVATNRMIVMPQDLDLWNSVFHDFVETLEPSACKSFKIGVYLNLN